MVGALPLLSFRISMTTVLSNRNLMAVTLTQSLLMFASFLWKPFWSLYILELGGSKSIVGALATLQSFSNLALLLPGGVLADRFGRKRVILASSIFSFFSPLLLLFSTTWIGLIPGIIASSFSALATPAQSSLIAESLPPEKRATAFGVYTMSWYMFIVVAYPFGGYVMDSLGVVPGTHIGLILSFLVMVPVLLIQWRIIRETWTPDQSATEREALRLKVALTKLRATPPELWILLAVAIFSCFGFQLFWSFVVVFCVEVLGISMMQWSIVSIVGNLVAACFMIPIGFLSDRAKRKPYIILSQVLVSAASLGYVLSTGFLGIALTRAVGGVGEGLGGNVFSSVGGPVWQALVTEVAPMDIRGSTLGLMGTITGFISTPAPWIGGYIYENISPQSPFYLSFVLGILGVTLFTFLIKEQKRPQQISG